MAADETEDADKKQQRRWQKVALSMRTKNWKTKPRTRLKFTLFLLAIFYLARQVQVQVEQANGWFPLAEASTLADYDGATFYKATVGSRVRIACNGSHWSDDSVGLVLWFKGSNSVPIYTVDARQKPLNQGARHFVSDAYKGRARFNTRATPPYLDLAPLEEEDQAEFRCRIDYRSRPRENFLVILFVLVPPKSVQVIDSNGKRMEQIYGPLSEGSDLTLLCLAKGGRPAPAVIWKQRNKVIDDSYLTLNDFLALRDPKLPASVNVSSSALAGSQRGEIATSSGYSGNVTPALAPNSISLEDSSSSSLSLVGSLYVEWRQWPEFEYLARLLDNSNSNSNSNRHRDSELVSISSPSSSYVQSANDLLLSEFATSDNTSGNNKRSRQDAAAATGSGPNQLLELPVHESITTSVNVLRLSSLGSSQQLSGLPASSTRQQVKRAIDANNSSSEQQPDAKPFAQFECQASNLHYDLRTLIKLFAPPSLAGSGQQPAGEAGQQATLRNGNGSGDGNPTRQLVEAIDRARESAFRSVVGGGSSVLSAEPTGGELDRSQSSLSGGGGGNASAAHLAVELLAAMPNHQPTGQLEEAAAASGDKRTAATSAGLTAGGRPNGIAGVIYQQLARPHQLASAAATQQQQQQQQSETTPTPSGQSTGAAPLPLVKTKQISLDVYLRPLDVRITSPTGGGGGSGQRIAHAAGQLAEFQCSTSGSRPAAKLTWYLNGRQLETKLSRQLDEIGGNASHSRLSLHLDREHNGAQLVCRAENDRLVELLASRGQQPSGSTAIEDSLQLTVHYAPRLKLELGNSMLSDAIKEFSDIYFVCHVDANPPVKEITWLHNESPINEAASQTKSQGQSLPPNTETTRQPSDRQRDGLIISNNSLVLQRVKLEQRGQYACVASNSEGVSESNRIKLRVLHAPICRPPQPSASSGGQLLLAPPQLQSTQNQRSELAKQNLLLVGSRDLALNTKSRFLCRMAADPPEVEITWYLNNSHTERRVLATRQADKIWPLENRKPQDSLAGVSPGAESRRADDDVDVDEQSSGRPAPSRLKPNYNNNNNKLDEDKSDDSAAGGKLSGRKQNSAGNSHHHQQPADDLVMVSSQLEYLVDSQLDYGQLYCVARNSIGEQKVACVYELQAPDPSDAQPISCLAVNVTATSVSLGCQLTSAPASTSSAAAPGGYSFSVAVYRAHRPQAAATPSDSSEFGAGEQLEANQIDTNDGNNNNADDHENLELEANLESGRLVEPLFSVTNLKSLASYELHVYLAQAEADSPPAVARQPAIVKLRTTSSSSPSPVAQADGQAARPKLEPISEQQQQQNLMAALISTRSTNGSGGGSGHAIQRKGHLASGEQRANKYAATGKWRPQPRQSDTNFLSDLWSRSVGRLLGFGTNSESNSNAQVAGADSAATGKDAAANLMSPTGGGGGASSRPLGRTRGNGNSIAINNQLMDLSDTLLITSVCLTLLGSLVLLLVLHRYSRSGLCAGRLAAAAAAAATSGNRSSAASSSSTCSSSTAAGKRRSGGLASGHLSKRSSRANGTANAPSSDSTASDEDQQSGDSNVELMQQVNLASCSPATVTGSCDTSNQPTARNSAYSSATLDARLLSSSLARQRLAPAQAQQLHLSGASATHQQFGGQPGELARANQYGAARVTRSRSSTSMCQQESSFMLGASHLNSSRQPRLIQLSGANNQQQQAANSCSLDRRIISDANLQTLSFMGIAELQAAGEPQNATNNCYASLLAGNNSHFQVNSATSPVDVNSSGSTSSTATTNQRVFKQQPPLQLYCNGTTSDCFAGSALNPQLVDLDHRHRQRPQSSSLISDEASTSDSNGFPLHHHQQIQWSALVNSANGQQIEHNLNGHEQVNFIHLLHPTEATGADELAPEYIESDLLLERLMVANDQYHDHHQHQSYFTMNTGHQNHNHQPEPANREELPLNHHHHPQQQQHRLFPAAQSSSCSIGSPSTATNATSSNLGCQKDAAGSSPLSLTSSLLSNPNSACGHADPKATIRCQDTAKIKNRTTTIASGSSCQAQP